MAFRALARRGHLAESFGKHLSLQSFLLCLPIIIIGSIRLGICTPTEAGAVAIAYAVILGIVYREIRWDNVLTCIRETVCSTASIMLIVGAASCFSWILTWENVPQTMTTVLISVCKNKYIFLLAVNIFLLVVGMFIEATAAQISTRSNACAGCNSFWS